MGMLKRLLYTVTLLGVALPVYAAPDSNLSITPTATSGTVITAADENDRNSDITTWANSHDHNDINQLANSVQLGDGTAGDKEIGFYDDTGTNGYIRWDDSENMVVLQQFGTSNYSAIVVSSGTVDLKGGEVLLGGGEGPIYSSGILGSAIVTSIPASVSNNVDFTRTTGQSTGSQAYTGMGFQPTAITVICSESAGSARFSMGLGDDDGDEANVFSSGVTVAFAYNSGEFIRISDGTDGWTATLTSLDSDGFTIGWTKISSGKNVSCTALGVN